MGGKLITTVAVAVLLTASAPVNAQQSELQSLSSTNAGAAQASPVAPAIKEPAFFGALAQDVKRLPSIDTALILGIGGAFALTVSAFDSRVTRTASGTTAIEEPLDPGETLGSGWVQAGGAVATLAIGHLTSNAEVRQVGSDLVRAQILAGVMTQGLKHAVNRTRPDGSRFSFPSGHASASFATAAVLQRHFGWKIGVPAFGAAAYASTSRLSENRHYASDGIFGAALGLVAGRTVTIGRSERRFALVPSVAPGAVAVNFVRIAAL
jgi:membrane-associated phospholipid phosphatase